MWNMIFGRLVHRCTQADRNLTSRLRSGELDGLGLISFESDIKREDNLHW